jgi:hypothetical protein
VYYCLETINKYQIASTSSHGSTPRSIPTISKGWEKERARVTALLSSCITIESEGINIPKWDQAGTAIISNAKTIKAVNLLVSFQLLPRANKKATRAIP